MANYLQEILKNVGGVEKEGEGFLGKKMKSSFRYIMDVVSNGKYSELIDHYYYFFEEKWAFPADAFFFNLITTHDYIMCYLVFVMCVVTWTLLIILINFHWNFFKLGRGSFLDTLPRRIYHKFIEPNVLVYILIYIYIWCNYFSLISESVMLVNKGLDKFIGNRLTVKENLTTFYVNKRIKARKRIFFTNKRGERLFYYVDNTMNRLKWRSRRDKLAFFWAGQRCIKRGFFIKSVSRSSLSMYKLLERLEFLKRLQSKETFVFDRNNALAFWVTDGVERNYMMQKWRRNRGLELFWTVTPTIIILIIIVPSLALLYSSGGLVYFEQAFSINANQWFWNYAYLLNRQGTIYNMCIPSFRTSVIKTNNAGEQMFRRIWEIEYLMDYPVFRDLYEFGFFGAQEYLGRLSLSFNSMMYPKELFKYPKEKMAIKDMCEMDAYMVTLDETIDILNNSSFKRLLDTTRHLKIPAYSFVKFSITSNDVLHSFSVPSAGIKIDAVTGRLNDMVTFFAKEALLVGQCSELCGAGHYGMPIVLECVHPNKFYAACTSDLWNSVNMGKSFLPISSRYWELVKHESGPIYEQLKRYTEFSKKFGLVTFVPI